MRFLLSAALPALLLASPADADETITITCIIEESRSMPEGVFDTNAARGEEVVFTFNASQGIVDVHRYGKTSDGEAVEQTFRTDFLFVDNSLYMDVSIPFGLTGATIRRRYDISLDDFRMVGQLDTPGYSGSAHVNALIFNGVCMKE